jgi:hypothetical protein
MQTLRQIINYTHVEREVLVVWLNFGRKKAIKRWLLPYNPCGCWILNGRGGRI